MSSRTDFRHYLIHFLMYILFSQVNHVHCLTQTAIKADTSFTHGVIIDTPPSSSYIFYETFVPILIHYELPPSFTEPSLRLTQSSSIESQSLCQSSTSPYVKKCPPHVNMAKLIKEEFANNLTWWDPLNDFSSDRPNSNGIFVNRNNNAFCTDITKHFYEVTTTPDNFNSYLKKLEECPTTGEHVIEKKVKNASPQRHSKYNTMSLATTVLYGDYVAATYQTFGAVTLNYQATLYSMLLLNSYMESNRWQNLINTCSSGNIDVTNIPPSELEKLLNETASKISLKNYELAIPIEDLGMYYKQPLTDCIFMENTKLTVRILVPIRQKTSKYQDFSVQPIPFIRGHVNSGKRQLCFLANTAGDKKNYILFQNTNNIAEIPPYCKANSICNVRQFQNNVLMEHHKNLCVSSILAKLPDGVLKQRCPMECWPIDDVPNQTSHPIFLEVSSDSFIISGGSVQSSVLVFCDSRLMSVIKPTDYDYGEGALQLWIPCDCQAFYNSVPVFHSRPSCNDSNEIRIKRLAPFEWNESITSGSTKTTKTTYLFVSLFVNMISLIIPIQA